MQIDYWQKLRERHYYHIYNRSNGGAMMFADSTDASDFMERWDLLIAPYMDTLAFCLMSNHFHFVVRIKELDEQLRRKIAKEETKAAANFLAEKASFNDFLVAQFARLFNGFSSAYNHKHNRNGGLFQKKFKRIRLRTVEKIVDRICYVHHNPLHHGAASYYDGWYFSSFCSFLTEKNVRIDQNIVFLLLKELGEINVLTTSELPHETGIYEKYEIKNTDIQRFVVAHINFHQDWMNKRKWTEFDDIGET